jgi:hypothetical protein
VWRLLGACPSSGWELVCRGEIPAINRTLVNKSGNFAFAIMSGNAFAYLSVLWIRFTLMRIRILIFYLMQIRMRTRIRLFTVMRIQIRFRLINWDADPNADPDPDFLLDTDADPDADPGYQNDADPCTDFFYRHF